MPRPSQKEEIKNNGPVKILGVLAVLSGFFYVWEGNGVTFFKEGL